MTMTMKEMWDRTGVDLSNDTYSQGVIQHRFLARQTTEAITAEKHMILKDITHLDVADKIVSLMETKASITGENDKTYFICGSLDKDHEILVFITQGARSGPSISAPSYDDDDDYQIGFKVNKVKIGVTGHRKAIKKVFSHLSETLDEAKVSIVKWWSKGDHHGASTKEIFLEPVKTILRPEFYPTLKNPNQYLKDYLNSDQSVLMIAGPPGTAKTTLIRHLISDFNLNAEIIYDESIMSNDSIFQSFLFGNSDVMIIEDADHIITSREKTSNPLMAMFLNVSQGIIQLPRKKLIFTTNLSDFGQVDPALTRAGRCYGTIHTRELTYSEACIAAKVAGLPEPQIEREYTLAELFSPDSGAKVRKTGF